MSNAKAAIAEAIFSSGAIRFGDFNLASGMKSPYYVDLSRLLTSPKNLDRFVRLAGNELRTKSDTLGVSSFASVELRGALLLSALSAYLGRPCYVVRKSAKTHGVTGMIVGGEVNPGQKFILFDDVITDGQSKLDSIRVLEESGASVKLVMVVVDREQGGSNNLARRGYLLESILTIHQLVSELTVSGLITPQLSHTVLDYLKDESKDVGAAPS